jgi:predicted Abi (CAAX) family protease
MAERCLSRKDAEARARSLLATHPKPAVLEIQPSLDDIEVQYWAVSSPDDADTVKGLLVGVTIIGERDR